MFGGHIWYLSCLVDTLELNAIKFHNPILHVKSAYHKRFLEKHVFLEICSFKVLHSLYLLYTEETQTLNFLNFSH